MRLVDMFTNDLMMASEREEIEWDVLRPDLGSCVRHDGKVRRFIA